VSPPRAERRLDRLFDRLLARRGWVLAAWGLLAAVALPGVARLETDNSPEVFFVQGSASLTRYRQLEAAFGSSEHVRLVASGDGLWTRAGLTWLGEIEARAAEAPWALGAIGHLELLFAKADFAAEFYGVVPRLSPEGAERIVLKNARHPLLQDILKKQRKHVVPMSVELDSQQRTLLISGPNTGGKTVALKTAGLLALMTHAALPVPADDAEFPLFDQVLADIGDHQSLAESLSSFSAHIVSIASMLDRATPDSLVLMDELGRATDPEEGGALGVTILEAFRKQGAFTVASTHLMAMKVYGASTPGVLNGSMGFDDATLEPTYILRLGAPGKSAGLDIASRLGLRPQQRSAAEDVGHGALLHGHGLGQARPRLQREVQQHDRRARLGQRVHAQGLAGDDAHVHLAVRAARLGNAGAGQLLVARRHELVPRGQVDPDLEAVHDAPAAQEALRGQLRVHDAGARGHPLHVARAQLAAVAARIAVPVAPLQHVGHRLEAAVRVIRRADGAARRPVHRAHLVDQQERVHVIQPRRGEGPAHGEAAALQGAHRCDALDQRSFRQGIHASLQPKGSPGTTPPGLIV